MFFHSQAPTLLKWVVICMFYRYPGVPRVERTIDEAREAVPPCTVSNDPTSFPCGQENKSRKASVCPGIECNLWPCTVSILPFCVSLRSFLLTVLLSDFRWQRRMLEALWTGPSKSSSHSLKWIKGVVSKETVVLRRWGSSRQEFGFINGVDNVKWPPYRDSKSWRFER